MNIYYLTRKVLLSCFLMLGIFFSSTANADEGDVPATIRYTTWTGREPLRSFKDGATACRYAFSLAPRYTNVSWNGKKRACEAVIIDPPPDDKPSDYSSAGIVVPTYYCLGGYIYQEEGMCRLISSPAPKKNSCEESIGNPVYFGQKIKRQTEVDYTSNNLHGLKFVRTYSSKQPRGYDYMKYSPSAGSFGRMGGSWLHNFSKEIVVDRIEAPTTAFMLRPEGTLLIFKNDNGQWITDADVSDRLFKNETGWKFVQGDNDNIEMYNSTGLLISVENRAGVKQTLRYGISSGIANDPMLFDFLESVTDQFGNKLTFKYNSEGRLILMIDPDGKEYSYTYNDSQNIDTVVYPSGQSRRYLYDEPEFVTYTSEGALTGIVDENNVRYATFKYYGYPISTEHYGGVEKYKIKYEEENGVTITDPLNSKITYKFEKILGAMRHTGQSQPGGSGCGPSSSSIKYDNNGNVESRTNFNGGVVTYTYDLKRNLEKTRSEKIDKDKPEVRVTTTDWHTTYSLPMKIVEPKRITSFTYDTAGNMLTKSLQATTDPLGTQGTKAIGVGPVRKWTYSYNTMGQVLTVKGPRTDISDVSTYTYDAAGHLATVENALRQIITFDNYDASGRLGSITEGRSDDVNKIVTTLTYWPRGWLKSRTVKAKGVSETTNYDYDGVGQLALVTMPDATTITYTNDSAHRLTGISDSSGNSITYTLDNMGNRLSEEVKDSGGALKRQTTRVIDALNRVQQITGVQ